MSHMIWLAFTDLFEPTYVGNCTGNIQISNIVTGSGRKRGKSTYPFPFAASKSEYKVKCLVISCTVCKNTMMLSPYIRYKCNLSKNIISTKRSLRIKIRRLLDQYQNKFPFILPKIYKCLYTKTRFKSFIVFLHVLKGRTEAKTKRWKVLTKSCGWTLDPPSPQCGTYQPKLTFFYVAPQKPWPAGCDINHLQSTSFRWCCPLYNGLASQGILPPNRPPPSSSQSAPTALLVTPTRCHALYLLVKCKSKICASIRSRSLKNE